MIIESLYYNTYIFYKSIYNPNFHYFSSEICRKVFQYKIKIHNFIPNGIIINRLIIKEINIYNFGYF